MTRLTQNIFVQRNSNGKFKYESQNYSNSEMSECEMIIHLGAVLGVNLTNPNYSNCSWVIQITKISTN